MGDIVERLRDVAGFIEKEHGRVAAAACLATEAAEEIERLRKDLSLAVFADKEYWQVLEKENERLRAALEVAANDLEDWGAYTKAKNAHAALEGK